MANTHTKTLTNPTNADAGSRRTDTLFAELQKTINSTQARSQNRVIVSQSYPDNIGVIDSTGGDIHPSDPSQASTGLGAPFVWRVPIIDYSAISILVGLKMITPPAGGLLADAVLTFKSTQGSSDISFGNMLANTSATRAATLNVQPPTLAAPGTYPEDEIVELFLTAQNGAKYEIKTITLYYSPTGTASNLPAGYTYQAKDKNDEIHRFQALGEDQFSGNRPMSAAVGRILIDNLNALNRRLEPAVCWSAVRLLEFNQTSNNSFQWYDAATPALIRIRDAANDPPRIVFWVRAENDGDVDAAFVVCVTGAKNVTLSEGPWPNGHREGAEPLIFTQSQTVAAGARGWYQIVTPPINLCSKIGAESPDLAIQAGVLSSVNHSDFGGLPIQDDDGNGNLTTRAIPRVKILGLSIWARP